MVNIVLVGLGPQAKEVYLRYIKKHKINLVFVIELESKKEITRKYLNENGFKDTEIFTIQDYYKEDCYLPLDMVSDLLSTCRSKHVSHMIISCEHKAYYMYLKFALKNDINVLIDEPTTIMKKMTNIKNLKEMKEQYYELVELTKNSKASCKVMCHGQNHKGYKYVKSFLEDIIKRFGVPITNIDIFSSRDEKGKKNHSCSYYDGCYNNELHYIDFLADLLKINECLGYSKKIMKGKVYSKVSNPNDKITAMGEKNYKGLLSFYNEEDRMITAVNLNFSNNGVSSENNIKQDLHDDNIVYYEKINIEIIHLLNIQIYKYRLKEKCNKGKVTNEFDDLEHFEIKIECNPLISRKKFQKLDLLDLYSENEKKDASGFNELSYNEFLNGFLSNNLGEVGNIIDKALAMEILFSYGMSLINCYSNKEQVEDIIFRNNYTFMYMVKDLKKYSSNLYKDYTKKNIKSHMLVKDVYTLYCSMKFVEGLKMYEVFMSLDDSKNVAGLLMHKTFTNKIKAYIYYIYLKNILNHKEISEIVKKIENFR